MTVDVDPMGSFDIVVLFPKLPIFPVAAGMPPVVMDVTPSAAAGAASDVEEVPAGAEEAVAAIAHKSMRFLFGRLCRGTYTGQYKTTTKNNENKRPYHERIFLWRVMNVAVLCFLRVDIREGIRSGL